HEYPHPPSGAETDDTHKPNDKAHPESTQPANSHVSPDPQLDIQTAHAQSSQATQASSAHASPQTTWPAADSPYPQQSLLNSPGYATPQRTHQTTRTSQPPTTFPQTFSIKKLYHALKEK